MLKGPDKNNNKHVKEGKQGQDVNHADHGKSADPYPWLDSEDPRRHMNDEEILWKYIDLKNSTLNEDGRAELMDIIIKHKKAFSLRDEIGECPNIKIDIDVIDDSPLLCKTIPH